MINAMASDMHLFKESDEEQVGGKYTKEKNSTTGKKKKLAGKMLMAFQNAASTFKIDKFGNYDWNTFILHKEKKTPNPWRSLYKD